jgi:hypothetical protein
MSENYIPPDFDRAGVDGHLIDSVTGAEISGVEWHGGWWRGFDGVAHRNSPGYAGYAGPNPHADHELQLRQDAMLLLLVM